MSPDLHAVGSGYGVTKFAGGAAGTDAQLKALKAKSESDAKVMNS